MFANIVVRILFLLVLYTTFLLYGEHLQQRQGLRRVAAPLEPRNSGLLIGNLGLALCCHRHDVCMFRHCCVHRKYLFIFSNAPGGGALRQHILFCFRAGEHVLVYLKYSTMMADAYTSYLVFRLVVPFVAPATRRSRFFSLLLGRLHTWLHIVQQNTTQ